MQRKAEVERITKETQINLSFNLDGSGNIDIASGIPFFDHMLTLFCVHGFFDLSLRCGGDIEVDYHHTIEDIGLTLGQAVDDALGERKRIRRYGFAVTPMDDALANVAIDLSKRPYLVFRLPKEMISDPGFDATLVKEFFRAFANKGGMNLHINVDYGENQHHILEAVFKATGRAMAHACGIDPKISGVRSSKGTL